MQTINRLIELRTAISGLKAADKSVALVPTMGALHDGHLKLVREAKARADAVIVSIFVNPAQFGPKEDFSAYPRTLESDLAKLAPLGTDIAWAPTAQEIYPGGFATSIHVGGPAEGQCGTARPGHFDGVALVVTKLFNQCQPDFALFGEKDWQQLAVIRQFVRDLDIAIEIIGVETVREADGLAMSSRNAYLSAGERRAAVALPEALQRAARKIASAAPVAATLDDAIASLKAAGFGPIDYFELVDSQSLQPVAALTGRSLRLLAAARMGQTRLIDNIAVA